jgi:hypothetical protein
MPINVHTVIVAPQALASVLHRRVAKADIGKPSITIKHHTVASVL